MADTLSIHEIVVECRIGVTDEERAAPQTIWIDLELAIDASRAAAHDDVREAVDYARLVAAVKKRAQATGSRLLETMAEAIATDVLRQFGTSEVRVRVKKRALPGIGYAAVEVVRARRVRTLRAAGRRLSAMSSRR